MSDRFESTSPVVAAFETLSSLVSEWRQAGKKTTTAGIKPALSLRSGGFDESEFGFTSFRDFVAAAEQAGFVKTYKPDRGHWLILLPGEEPPAETSPGYDQDHDRLKAPVWSMFVEWSADWVRRWDRRSGRAFWYPVNGEGRPLWETDPDRFVEIAPVPQDTQLGWMRSWAESLPEASKVALLPTIGDHATPGEFRATLSRLALVAAWRDELRRRIVEHAKAWSEQNEVSWAQLVDTRRNRPNPERPSGEPVLPDAVRDPVSAERRDDSFESQVREQLRACLDRMSLEELLEVRVPFRATLESR